MSKKYYKSCAVGYSGLDQTCLSLKLDECLRHLGKASLSVESITPHTVNRGEKNEYLEYIIVYSWLDTEKHKCYRCEHYLEGEHDGGCDSYIFKNKSDYEEKQPDEEMRIGDEVDDCGVKSVVIKVWKDSIITLSYFGCTSTFKGKKKPKKTGRHFPQIEEIYLKMQEGKE